MEVKNQEVPNKAVGESFNICRATFKLLFMVGILIVVSACATYSFLPETSKKYPKKKPSNVETYSFEKCPFGTRIGRMTYNGVFIINEEQELKGAVRRAAAIGADFICYDGSGYIAFVGFSGPWERFKQALYKVQIISSPPGANIELNNDYMGKAPLTISILGSERGHFLKAASFVALPIVRGHCVQDKHFAMWDEIPRKLFFDTALCPINRNAIDLNLNK